MGLTNMSTPIVCYRVAVVAVVAERVSERRKSLGMKQVELAAAMGTNYAQSTLAHVETGRSGISIERAADCARALEVSLDWLCGLTDDPRPAAELSRRLREATGEKTPSI